MATCTKQDYWSQFIAHLQIHASAAEFANWIKPISLKAIDSASVTLSVPNVFVQEYLLDNFRQDLLTFLPTDSKGNPAIIFEISENPRPKTASKPIILKEETVDLKLNRSYTFETFIEGPANQFVKSAAMGVASKPGHSYNPLFVHGGVGLGKTHLLHAIAHHVQNNHKKLKILYVTAEGFINDLIRHLKGKSLDKMKQYYRSLDVLLIDDIQFLQNRPNFEEELCSTIEALINQNKQVVISSDKPPAQLKLSERLVARMEWGLVAHLACPDLETRVAILQSKAEQKGIRIPSKVAFFIAEHIFQNVRQLEGAINRLSAYCRLMHLDVTEEVAEKTLGEMFCTQPNQKVSVDSILKSVAAIFDVRLSDLRGCSRMKEIAYARQVAMYLAKELIPDSLVKLASAFGGKTHSTLLHAWKKIKNQLTQDEMLKRQVQLARREIGA
ncbi:MAG: chromosomal replication initiator protein DnaA [Chlamydiia bacterium]|nr:chromosomal replication initiator protein DnaA [Chlamydiia bacterium]MCP5510158.1 chromosomal replication initiator protein DnaA [Chlamydiales bacterium]